MKSVKAWNSILINEDFNASQSYPALSGMKAFFVESFFVRNVSYRNFIIITDIQDDPLSLQRRLYRIRSVRFLAFRVQAKTGLFLCLLI